MATKVAALVGMNLWQSGGEVHASMSYRTDA